MHQRTRIAKLPTFLFGDIAVPSYPFCNTFSGCTQFQQDLKNKHFYSESIDLRFLHSQSAVFFQLKEYLFSLLWGTFHTLCPWKSLNHVNMGVTPGSTVVLVGESNDSYVSSNENEMVSPWHRCWHCYRKKGGTQFCAAVFCPWQWFQDFCPCYVICEGWESDSMNISWFWKRVTIDLDYEFCSCLQNAGGNHVDVFSPYLSRELGHRIGNFYRISCQKRNDPTECNEFKNNVEWFDVPFFFESKNNELRVMGVCRIDEYLATWKQY